MENQEYNIEPHSEQGIIIKDGYSFKIISVSPQHTKRVHQSCKILSTGEKAYVFKNNNDSDITISVFRVKNL